MRVKVFLTLDIDEDEYPVPVDGEVSQEIEEAFSAYIYDIDGLDIKTINVLMLTMLSNC